ncbi:GIY-YIG nuclease family protein [Pseudomonas aeruginosa]|uniref:GIY-YIG nuclease family protein n=1 Tax=Pseudomonas aeruginosa TaxID=287 RepID=UPI000EB01D79|nr:GIY-YIG nuclease family protein [Pseudomonas aeruginosa]
MNYGFIYCLGNQAMPGIYKVGMTERAPLQRRDELSNSTSAPLPFELLCFGQVIDPRDVESDIHSALSDRRVNQYREFFYGPFSRIADFIRDYSNGFALTSYGKEEEEREELRDRFYESGQESRIQALCEAAKSTGVNLQRHGQQLRFSGRLSPSDWMYGAFVSLRDELLEFVPEFKDKAQEEDERTQEAEQEAEELDW